MNAAPAAPVIQGAPDAVVTIHAGQFRWGGESFDSLEALEARMLPRTPRSVGLRACGTEATPALLTAAHRLRHLELYLNVDESGDAHCAAGLMPPQVAVASREDRVPSPDGNDAVPSAWWQQCMP